MVKKLLILFVFVVFFQNSNGDSLSVVSDSSKYKIELDSEFYLSSNALSTQHITKFYFGKSLSYDLRKKTSDRAISGNRAGFSFTNDVSFGMKTQQINWTFGFSDRMFSDMKFTDDLYDLVFLGNRDYEGKTADISSCALRYWRYEQLSASAEFKRGNATWVAGLGIVNAHNFFQVETGETTLFTDTFGIALDLKAESEFRHPHPGSTKAFSRGTGVAVRLEYMSYFESINSDVRLFAHDIGFVYFNKGIVESIDTTFRYEGFDLEQLFFSGDSINPQFSGDSLKRKYAQHDSTGFAAMLPGCAGINISQKKGNWTLTESVILRPFTYTWPEFRFEAGRAHGKFCYSITGHLGGFNYAGLGFKAGYSHKNTKILLDLSQIEGWVIPGVLCGSQVGLRFSRCF